MTLFKNTSFNLLKTIAQLMYPALFGMLAACEQETKPPTPLEEGQALSKIYCGSCHKYPQPALIDSTSWAGHVLPAMAPRLGIQVYGDDQYVNNPNKKSTVTFDEWTKIVSFYKSTAPKILKAAVPPVKSKNNWAFFSLKIPAQKVSAATTTMVAFDTLSRHFYTSDMDNMRLYQWSDKMVLQASEKFESPCVDVKFYKDSKQQTRGAFTFIGSFDAFDTPEGKIYDIDLKSLKNAGGEITIAKRLNRPVQSASADFNKDGLPDWLTCQFGHNGGELTLLTQGAGNIFTKKTIRNVTGPTNISTGDFNNDGWPDFMCLFAQGDEGIWMFLNDKKGGFTSQNLLRFPPVYGSTSFQLVDFNNDGKLDILYTCGDNSDYSRVLKPYHGVYIFLNQGNYKYKQAWFYPINGATKAIAADFNGDKKRDIAVIAFFSDLKNNPAEGFTYFEQTQTMKFTANNIPVNKYGRWLSMAVEDYNHDGKPDIILGNLSVGFINQPGVTHTWDGKTPFVVLQNDHGK